MLIQANVFNRAFIATRASPWVDDVAIGDFLGRAGLPPLSMNRLARFPPPLLSQPMQGRLRGRPRTQTEAGSQRKPISNKCIREALDEQAHGDPNEGIKKAKSG